VASGLELLEHCMQASGRESGQLVILCMNYMGQYVVSLQVSVLPSRPMRTRAHISLVRPLGISSNENARTGLIGQAYKASRLMISLTFTRSHWSGLVLRESRPMRHAD
jgi:hypothetical protein